MKTASVSNVSAYNQNTALKNNSNSLGSTQMKVNLSSSSLKFNTQKSHNPSFGWFGIDDLFYYFNRDLNKSREAKRREQIEETNQKVVDDISLLAKKLRIPSSVAKEKYNEYLKIGGIEPKRNGHEVGLNQVIGYSKEKLDLIKDVVTPIVASQLAAKKGETLSEEFNIPNGVIFYGPKGRGKSFMAESLLEHFKEKSKDMYLNIRTVRLDKPWKNGDTDENAYAIADAFEEAKKYHEEKNGHTIIYIDAFDKLLNETDNPILCAEFITGATNCKDNGITWVGNIISPKVQPDWLFNPNRTSVCVPVRNMSDTEMSAVMSYFWAYHDRKDNSNHNEILSHLDNINLDIYPPQFKNIAKEINKSLGKKDYDSYKRGHYKEPVKTNDVISALETYKAESELENQSRKRAISTLDSLTDDSYILKIQEKYNANK